MTDQGFVINPCDSCVANKTIKGKQLTVVWHVDDLKMSHVCKKVVDEFMSAMETEFGKETPLNVSRGKKHDCLGMEIDFSKPGEVAFQMIDCIKGVLQDAPDDMKGLANTPAAGHLFKVNDKNPVILTSEKRDSCVHTVMQLLHLSQRARPDIRTAKSFLCA